MRARGQGRHFSRAATGRRRGLATVASVGIAALGLGLAAPPPASAATGPATVTPAQLAPSTRPITPATHLPAGVTPKTSPVQGARGTVSAAPAGAHLNYYGGKVIPDVAVTQVLYGSGTYTSEVQNTAAPSIASFYGAVTNTSYFDWLSEYNTVGVTPTGGGPSSNQTIGRGSFASQVQITPAGGTRSTVDDTQIQAELHNQIAAGHLAMPTQNTLYAVYFPANVTITQGGSSSGVQFCAYHGTVAASGSVPEFYYSVLPDFTTGGMTSGCGGGTRFQNETSVSSHEMIEAVTDAEVGIGTTVSRPLAWYDPTNGEIGDICNAQQQAITGSDGRSYTVQKEFSNRQNNCVVSGPVTANDFSISTSPTSASVTAGSSANTTVSTAVTAGSAGSVSLSASGLPSGVSASFNPTSVTAGGSSTLTVATGATTPAGNYTITVTGTEGSATHSVTFALTVNGSGGGGGGLTNGGFETGNLSGWTSSGTTGVVGSGAQAGTYAARVGGTSATNGDSSVAQTFTVPSNGSGVSFWYNVTCPDTVTYDWATVTLKDNTTGTTTTPLAKTCVNPTSGWKQVTAAAIAGHSVTLTLTSHDDNYPGDPTYTLYDSVSVTTSAPPSNDFSMALSPTSVTVTQGSSATATVSTAVSSGSAATVSLSASGAPSAATASLNPTSVTAGGSSTLTVATGASTPVGTYTITVTGTEGSATHSAALSLTVNAPTSGGGITNGGFETGNLSGWTTSGAHTAITTTSHSGTYAALAGNTTPTNGDSSIAQTFTAPTGTTHLGLWYANSCPDTVTYDWVTVTLKDNTTNTTATIVARTCAASYVWTQAGGSVTAGHSYTLTLTSHDDNYGADPTYTLFDDVTLS
jgi:hypothetical protein